MPRARGNSRERQRGVLAEARAALETPEGALARRRRKREEGVRAVKRSWHYRTLEDLDAARPPTPPTSPRASGKRGFEKAIQEWRKELSEQVQQCVKRGELAEVYLEVVGERVVIRSFSCPARSRGSMISSMGHASVSSCRSMAEHMKDKGRSRGGGQDGMLHSASVVVAAALTGGRRCASPAGRCTVPATCAGESRGVGPLRI